MANVPRKHHYVPQVLLAGFTSTGTKTGTLHVVDLIRGTTYPSTPEGTASERDYNLVEVDGVNPFAIESGLLANEIEGPAGPALDHIRDGLEPTEDDRVRLLAFMAMQELRGPSRREAFDDFTTRTMRLVVAAATGSDEMFCAQKEKYPELRGYTRDEVRDWAEHTKVQNSPTGHLQVQLPSFGPLLDLLSRRSWLVLVAPDDTAFVCTDNPVALVPAGTRPLDAPRGFIDADTPVFMPVGRRYALLGIWPAEGEAAVWPSVPTCVRRSPLED